MFRREISKIVKTFWNSRNFRIHTIVALSKEWQEIEIFWFEKTSEFYIFSKHSSCFFKFLTLMALFSRIFWNQWMNISSARFVNFEIDWSKFFKFQNHNRKVWRETTKFKKIIKYNHSVSSLNLVPAKNCYNFFIAILMKTQ